MNLGGVTGAGIHSARFGFVKLNNAHNGKRLGGVLFKIVD